ncbi:MAG: thioredoxin domain-containing protein [Gemmatimonadetes bacterium]|nr:thioredoxin domain-containing protein [Gemmatimonadota bacterium]
MAQGMNLKPFYWGLGVVALGGGAWIWASASRGPSAARFTELPPATEVAAAAGFEGYVLGSDSAPVVVDEYADYQCPYCARFWALTFHDVEQRLIRSGKVRWRFHDRPIDGLHSHARAAAHAAACGDEQGRFWEMHDALFGNQGGWSAQRDPGRTFRGYAQAVGLDLEQYDDCMETGRYRGRVQAQAEAADRLGISSTPTIVIGRMKFPQPPAYDELRRVVDSLSARPTPSR